MPTVTQEWLSHQEELLGRLARCREDLTDLPEEAELERIEEAVQELQGAIDESAQNQTDEEEEENSADEEEEEEGEEEEDEEEE